MAKPTELSPALLDLAHLLAELAVNEYVSGEVDAPQENEEDPAIHQCKYSEG